MKPVKYNFIPSDFSETKQYLQVETHFSNNFAEQCALQFQRKKKKISNRVGGELGNARLMSAVEDVVSDQELIQVGEIFNKPLRKITQEDIELYRETEKCSLSEAKLRRTYFKSCKLLSENSVRCESIGDTYGYTDDQITRSKLMNLSVSGAIVVVDAAIIIYTFAGSYLATSSFVEWFLTRSTFWRSNDVGLGIMTTLSGLLGGGVGAGAADFVIEYFDYIDAQFWFDKYQTFSLLQEKATSDSDRDQLLSRKEADRLRLSESFSSENTLEVVHYMDDSFEELEKTFRFNLGLLKSNDSRYK